MKKVLVVDDEAAIAEGLKLLFELENIEAASALDRETAETLIQQDDFAVVLADVRLRSDEDGFQLVEHIRALRPQTRIASMTGYATPEMEQRLLTLGSTIVLPKSVDLETIVATVRDLLRAELPVEATEQLSDEAIYEEVHRLTYAIPMRKFGLSMEESEDVVQEAWTLFFTKRETIQSPRAWLAGTITNLCKQAIQSRMRSRERYESYDGPEEDNNPSHAAPVSDTETVLSVRQALASLDERSRLLCTLLGIEGWSYDEVSDELGLPIGSIGPLYIRAKKKLRTALEMAN